MPVDDMPLGGTLLPESETPATPKRGRGRPPGSKNSAGPSTEGRPARANRLSKSELKRTAVTLVGGVNIGIAFSPWKDDALSDPECDLLADALVAECEASERIMRWMGRAAGVTPHILLARALYQIAVPRLQRHGMLPAVDIDNLPPHESATCEQMGIPCPTHNPDAYAAYQATRGIHVTATV